MSEDLDRKVAIWRERLLKPACTFFAAQKVYGGEVRESTKTALGDLRDAHLLVMGVIGAVVLRTNGKLTPYDAKRSTRSRLFAALLIGVSLCEQAIEEGRYLQAQALIRQEMELLARLVGVRTSVQKAGRTPNVALLEQSLARLYGPLSNAAHLAPDMVREATRYVLETPEDPGSVDGTRYRPDFDGQAARRAFALHLLILIHATAEMSGDWSEAYPEDHITQDEAAALDLAIALMVREGMLETDEPVTQDS